MNNYNKILVWSALEELWYGVPLRVALSRHNADFELYFETKRDKSIYIPAFDKNFSLREYNILCKFNLDLVSNGNKLELIKYGNI